MRLIVTVKEGVEDIVKSNLIKVDDYYFESLFHKVTLDAYRQKNFEIYCQVFSLLDLLLGPFSLRLPLGLSSLRQVFSLLGLLLGSFSLRLIPLGLSSLCQGFLFIRSSLKSLFFTSSFRCVGWECVYLLSTKVFSLSLRSFSLRFPLGLSILCQGCLFIRPSLRSSFYRSIFSLLRFSLY
ncbi:hypothetical protein RhiirA1_456319 [Rhizophagus irregularis]|uniref:Uncharacterized protein n=1 Tax=Rhizophagus irregularis TaxID=588596 RepID=A0A2N0S0V8_9GLOM|nr:hypothetical protein RhiirA1_456319 [Rhizophagus irregularis]